MTTAASVTQVSHEGESLLARCSSCGTELRQVDGFDPDVALGTLFQHHPASPAAVHRPVVPAGWWCANELDTVERDLRLEPCTGPQAKTPPPPPCPVQELAPVVLTRPRKP
jgi:hypothetical protein